MRKYVLAVGVLAAAVFSSHAYAGACLAATGSNLVADPNFEQAWNGVVESQTTTTVPCWSVTPSAGADAADPIAPGHMNGFLLSGSLSQAVASTVAGATYAISFSIAEDGDLFPFATTADTLVVGFGGNSDVDTILGNDPSITTIDGYLDVTGLTALGDGSTTDLTFSATEPTLLGNFYIDNISVTCDSAACAPVLVPEPNSLAILMVALFGFGAWEFVRRRNRMID